MKIVVYSPTYHPIIDGTSIQAIRLVKELSKKHEVYGLGYAVNRDICLDKKLLTINDNIERLLPDYLDESGKFPKLSGASIVLRLADIIPDIVHIRGWYQFEAVKEIFNASKSMNSITYWHGDGLHECHEAYKNNQKYVDCISNAVLKDVNFIGNSSQDTKLFINMGIPKNRIFEIAPFLQESAYNTKDWNNPRIITIGRFFDFKRQNKVIDVSQKINPKLDVIVAGASDTQYFTKFLEKNKSKASIIIDPSDSLVKTLYDTSTHFVLASEIETLGIVTLESIKAGCVPLARKIGGIKSYLSDTYLFESDVEMESKLRFLLKPDNALTAYNELQLLRDSLSNTAILKKLYDIYEKSARLSK